jgi:aconitase A
LSENFTKKTLHPKKTHIQFPKAKKNIAKAKRNIQEPKRNIKNKKNKKKINIEQKLTRPNVVEAKATSCSTSDTPHLHKIG